MGTCIHCMDVCTVDEVLDGFLRVRALVPLCDFNAAALTGD